MRTLAAAAVLALVPLAAPAAADAAGQTCQGQAATLVGKPGGRVEGTDGPDVVVSRGASYVVTGDGDDLVCVTGATKDGLLARVVTGEGDDSVVVTSTTNVKAWLGFGEDTYAGRGEKDVVFGGQLIYHEELEGTPSEYVDDEPDSITTGGGADSVEVRDGDTVALGSGNDSAHWDDSPGEPVAATVDGGSGRNTLGLNGDTEAAVPPTWELDTRSGALTRDGALAISFRNFGHYYPFLPGDLVVTGSSHDERFSIFPGFHYGTSGHSFAVRAGAGDDEIDVLATDVDIETRTLDGGAGRDRIHVHGFEFVQASIVVDLAEGSYRYDDPDGASAARFRNIEDAEVERIPDVTLRGDSSANRLSVHADQTDWPVFKRCQITIAGGGGDDRVLLLSTPIAKSWKNCPRPVLRGDAGNDVLVGSLLPERLLGGPGRDVARGGPGTDVCVVETQMGCERR